MSGCWWPSPTWNNWAYSARISCQVLYFFTVHLVNSRRLTCRYHALYRLSAPLRASTKEEDKMSFVAAFQTRGTWDAIATVVNHSEAISICHGPDITCQELERDASGAEIETYSHSAYCDSPTVCLTACNYESTTSPVARNIERGYKESSIDFPGKRFHSPWHWESLYQVSHVSWSVTGEFKFRSPEPNFQWYIGPLVDDIPYGEKFSRDKINFHGLATSKDFAIDNTVRPCSPIWSLVHHLDQQLSFPSIHAQAHLTLPAAGGS